MSPSHFSSRDSQTFVRDINVTGSGLFSAPDRDFKVSDPIKDKDILSWREREQQWDTFQRTGEMRIKTTIEVFTDLIDVITIDVQAVLKKPEIVFKSKIDFG